MLKKLFSTVLGEQKSRSIANQLLLIVCFVVFQYNFAFGVIGLDEDFEEWSSIPGGSWNYGDQANAGEQATLSTTEGNNDPKCVKFHSYDSTGDGANEDWLITPGVSLPSDATNISLNFYQKRTYEFATEVVTIKISTTGNTPSDFSTDLVTSLYTDYDSFHQEAISIDAGTYAGSTIYIAWQYKSDDQDNWLLDDVTITYDVPAVPGDPTSPSPANAGQDISITADLSWTNGADTDNIDLYFSSTQTDVANKVAGAKKLTSSIATTYDPGTMSNATTYYWRIVAKNSNRAETDGPIWSFTTENAAVTSFPWSEDFENSGSIPSSWINYGDDSGEDWNFSIPGNNVDPAQYGADQDHTSGAGYIAWIDDDTPDATPTSLIAPPFDVSGLTTPTLSFWYWIGDATNDGILYIDVYDGDTDTWNNSVNSVTANDQWSKATINISSYTSTNTKVRFRGVESTGFQSDICIDDVQVSDNVAAPNCTTPISPTDTQTGVAVDGQLKWNIASGATDYKLYFGTDASATNIVNGTAQGNVTAYDYSDLTPNITYYWKIVPTNTGGDATGCSIWSFTTVAAVASFPWSENFENTGSIPDGWGNDSGDSGEDWLFSTGGVEVENASQDHTSGSGYFAYVDDSSPHTTPTNLISPPIDLTGTTSPQLSFWYWIETPGTNSTLYIDVYNGSSWTSNVSTISANGEAWAQGSVDISSYTSASAAKIRFRGVESDDFQSDICIDDVSISEAIVPNCTTPVSPTDTQTSVEVDGILSWNTATGATGYKLWFGTDGSGSTNPTTIENGTDLGNTTSYNYSDLNPNTIHYWKIVAYNGAGDASGCNIWSFTTISSVTVTNASSWDEDFENGGIIPTSWVNDPTDSGEEWDFAQSAGGGASADHTTGSGYFGYVDDSAPHTTPTTLITPPLDISAVTTPNLKLWYWISDVAEDSQLHIDVFNGSSWTSNVRSLTVANGQWEEIFFDIGAYKSTNTKIRFRGIEASGQFSDICIDDVSVFNNTNVPGCTTIISPTDAQSNVSVDGTLDWNIVNGATGYKLYFGTDGLGSSTPTNIENGTALGDVTTYNYSSLAYNTTHYWQIVPYNTNGDASGCTTIWSFDTENNPLPVDLIIFYGNSVPLGIELYWKTASELNNKGFYIYRDGERISDIIPGFGTTATEQSYTYLDTDIEPNTPYTYQLSDVTEFTGLETFHQEVTIISGDEINPQEMPEVYHLYPNSPNPFNPSTEIKFDLPQSCKVDLWIYDAKGKLIKKLSEGRHWDAGYHTVQWEGIDENGQSVPSGIYLYYMQTDIYNKMHKMVLIK